MVGSTVSYRVAENRLLRYFHANQPNQKRVTDVTQYQIVDKWLCLSVVKKPV